MPKRSQVSTLQTYMNGIPVGQLDRFPGGGMVFTYARSWLESERARPLSLSMPLTKEPHRGDEVYNFFDNLLPDSSAIRARIQARFQCATDRPFDLLESVGGDCVGAVQLLSSSEQPNVRRIKATPLREVEIARLLKNYREAPLGMSPDVDDFRISMAGAQEKAAFLKHKDQWCRPMGATPTSHIFKLPIGILEGPGIDLTDSCENEWLCHKIAAAFGLPVARSEIRTFAEQKVLVVERFDRQWSQDGSWLMRLPAEDACQALGVSPQLKYERDGGPGMGDIMDLLLGSETAQADRDIFFKTQILFWLLAAIDGHAKNFSIFILPDGTFRLAPLYDIMTAYPVIAKGQLPVQKATLAMAVHGKNRHYDLQWIQPRHWISTALKIKYSEELARQYLNEMFAMLDTVIDAVSDELPENFPEDIAAQTFDGMHQTRDKHLPDIKGL